MANVRELDYNPLSGMRVTWQYNDADDSVTIGHHQDVESIIEDNKLALLDLETHKKQSKAGWAAYAKIPEIVILEWKAKYGLDFMNPNHFKRCMALLNDPEYKYLKRTSYHHDR